MERTELYRYFSIDEKLLYVGISKDTLERKKQHRRSDAKWKQEYATMTLETFDTRELALIAEKNAIINENPIYNIIHNTPKKEIPKKKSTIGLGTYTPKPPREITIRSEIKSIKPIKKEEILWKNNEPILGLSIIQYRILQYCMSDTSFIKKLENDEPFIFSVIDFKNHIYGTGGGDKSLYRSLRNSGESFVNKSLILYNDTGKITLPWVKIAHVDNGTVTIQFNMEIKDFLISLYKNILNNGNFIFSSTHTYALYFFLLRYRKTKSLIISPEELNKFLANGAYKFADLYRCIIVPVTQEINSNCRFTVDVSYIKKGRKTTQIIFNTKNKG